MNNYLRILIISLFVTIYACSGSNTPLEEEQIELSESMHEKFGSMNQLVYGGDTLLAGPDVLSYYKNKDFVPLWIRKDSLTDAGTEMLDFVKNARDYGLLPEMYHYSTLTQMIDSSLMDAEMLLSNAFFLFTTHLSVGCVEETTLAYTWKKDSLDFKPEDELEKVRNGTPVADIVAAVQPDFWEYKQLQQGLAAFLDLYPLDTNHYTIPAFKEDSVSCYKAAREALIGHAFLDSTEAADDSVFLEKLKIFQSFNGLKDDAIVGKWTGKALEKSNLDRFYQAAASLEKWRWRDAFPAKYIRVNIPEFTLYFVEDGQTKRKHRVVVGAMDTPTPEFHATMERMITNPFWSVPFSIASTEILYGARKDTAYFNKRGYKVFQNGEQVDPASINWSSVKEGSFGYRVRQDAGGGNSLGRIKFLFPNEHAVFIHDTPSKNLFANDVRAYSHGCIRLHQPYELAKEMLRSDGNTLVPDSLESIINRGIQRTIELKQPFEVFIEYYTASGDSSATIKFHPDIYGRDEKYLKNSFKKFNPHI
ncbi:MAG: L,D-transpeptidase family protein [Bacteroidetes bacterium]|nr:L,D-transpeptidase family protein [Bacteroidota bacterium]